MNIKAKIDQNLKQAMLAGDKTLVTTLRGLKSAILYAEVAKGARDNGLSDAEVLEVLSKEAKKRQESAEMYAHGGSPERAAAEEKEKTLIEQYLPAQLSDETLDALVETVIGDLQVKGPQAMGQVIAEVKKRSSGQADGSRIAAAVRERL